MNVLDLILLIVCVLLITGSSIAPERPATRTTTSRQGTSAGKWGYPTGFI